MSELHLYREIHFSRLGGTVPEKVGTFVVGIPTKAVEAYHEEHPTDSTDAVFHTLVSEEEHERMETLLGGPFINLKQEQIPFDAETLTLGPPTFEGEEGRKFWRLL